MIGPAVVFGVFMIGGALAGGWAGAAGGAVIAVGLIAAVVAGAAIWAQQIGSQLDIEDARDNAPRPPGFARLCDYVYERVLK